MHFCVLAPLHGTLTSEDISPYGEVYLYNTLAENKLVSKILIERCVDGPICLIKAACLTLF